MLLDRIQEHLEAIYGIRCELKVSDYLVDAASAKALGGSGDREQLLVSEGDETLELALFVQPELISRLETREAREAARHQLGDFCEATEGVSHFLYMHRAATLDRQVSLLELEAQSEVDKFASCALLDWAAGSRAAKELHARIFDRVGYRADLEPHERWRYEEANRIARAYCKRLLEHVTARRLDALLAELRATYRLGAEAKLARLSQL